MTCSVLYYLHRHCCVQSDKLNGKIYKRILNLLCYNHNNISLMGKANGNHIIQPIKGTIPVHTVHVNYHCNKSHCGTTHNNECSYQYIHNTYYLCYYYCNLCT